MVALYSNRRLCFLKLGRTLSAINDAENALETLGAPAPENISAWAEASHRLAGVLTRAGRFKEARARLDAIDKATRSRASTAELRATLRSLQDNCSATSSGHATLLDHLKQRRASLLADLGDAEPEEGWFVIREHFANFPLLFLLDKPELRQRCRKLPGKMLNLMAMVQRAQDPEEHPEQEEVHQQLILFM